MLKSDGSKTVFAYREDYIAINDESERGAILVSAEILNNHLKELLSILVVQKDSLVWKTEDKNICDFKENNNKQIWSGSGALGSFLQKIQIAWAFGLISKKTYTSIECIRQARNEFAHSSTKMSLTDPKIKQILSYAERAIPATSKGKLFPVSISGSEEIEVDFSTAIGDLTNIMLYCNMNLYLDTERIKHELERGTRASILSDVFPNPS